MEKPLAHSKLFVHPLSKERNESTVSIAASVFLFSQTQKWGPHNNNKCDLPNSKLRQRNRRRRRGGGEQLTWASLRGCDHRVSPKITRQQKNEDEYDDLFQPMIIIMHLLINTKERRKDSLLLSIEISGLVLRF
jgi:hypothetical protein